MAVLGRWSRGFPATRTVQIGTEQDFVKALAAQTLFPRARVTCGVLVLCCGSLHTSGRL